MLVRPSHPALGRLNVVSVPGQAADFLTLLFWVLFVPSTMYFVSRVLILDSEMA